MKRTIIILGLITVALTLTWIGEKQGWGESPPSYIPQLEHEKNKTKKDIKIILNKDLPKGHPDRVITICNGDTVPKDEEYYKYYNALKEFRDSL